MRIYRIDSNMQIRDKDFFIVQDFHDLILKIADLGQICMFTINVSDDPLEFSNNLLKPTSYYLIFPELLEKYFVEILHRYNAIPVMELPIYRNVSVIVGDPKAIPMNKK